MTECCNRGKGEETYPVQLTFLRSELMYDIENYAYIESDIQGEESQHAKHMTADIGDRGNVDRVNRVLTLAHAKATEMLYPYSKREVISGELDDVMRVPERYTILLQVPPRMSRTTTRLLEKLVHEYMVYEAVADWLSITNPEASKKWYAKIEQTREEINKAKSQLMGATTRRMWPAV